MIVCLTVEMQRGERVPSSADTGFGLACGHARGRLLCSHFGPNGHIEKAPALLFWLGRSQATRCRVTLTKRRGKRRDSHGSRRVARAARSSVQQGRARKGEGEGEGKERASPATLSSSFRYEHLMQYS